MTLNSIEFFMNIGELRPMVSQPAGSLARELEI